jgi:hypothetical protein
MRFSHDLPAANRLALGKSPKNEIFRHFSLAVPRFETTCL